MNKVEEMNLELTKILEELWKTEGPRMIDGERELSHLTYLLGLSGSPTDSTWYQLSPATYIVTYQVQPQVNAMFRFLGSAGVDESDGKRHMISICRDLKVKRLTLAVPSPVVDVIGAGHKLGFEVEGTLRFGARYNGDLTDLVIMGFIDDRKPKRRRRRKRKRARKQST